jgi:hypothetical protein
MTDFIKLIHTFSALADLGQEVAETSDFDEMVHTSLHLLLGSLAIMRGGIGEYESQSGAVHLIARRNLSDDLSSEMFLLLEEIDELCEVGLSVIETKESEAPAFVAHNCERLEQMRIKILLPLVVQGKLIGLIFLGEKASGESYTEEDKTILCSLARQIGVGMQERRQREELERRAAEVRHLYDGLRAIYRDTVKAFAAAIDCKDKYTQGHSDRVGKYCEIIAREMGWDEEEVEGITIAGYLHDVGKLVVERNIINAPYRINAKESAELSKHPMAGFEILAPIHHPYTDIPQAARYHHERIDGRGYPEGLKGDEIPIGAKIVNVADSFDAMTTDRPYKRRRSLEEVIDDLQRNSGKQFAQEVVIAFCRAMLKEFSGENKEKRFRKLLGKDYIVSTVVVPKLETVIQELSGKVATASA